MSNELQTLALKIARHRWPDAAISKERYGWPVLREGEVLDPYIYELDDEVSYRLWQEIASKYAEKCYAKYPDEHYQAYLKARSDAYEASRTPLGIAKAYVEVYGLED